MQVSSCGQQRLIDYTNVQDDLSFCGVHMSESMLSRVLAHLPIMDAI